MASIFDDIDIPSRPVVEEPKPRSKKREALTGYEVVQGKRRLADMVEIAFDTLEEAAKTADHATAVKAATAILDRAGFGPKSTVDVNTTTIDLTTLSRAELAERASKVHQMLKDAQLKALPAIDATVVKTETIQ